MRMLKSLLCATSIVAVALTATSASAYNPDPKSPQYEEIFVDVDTGKQIKLRGTKASIDKFIAEGKYKKHTNPRAWQNMQDSAELNAALHTLKDGEQLHPVKLADGTTRFVKTSAPSTPTAATRNIERQSAANASEIRPRPRGTHRMDRVGLGPGDWADGVTTAIGLAQEGVKEANPLLAPFGDGASVAAIGLKYGAKHYLNARGYRPSLVNYQIETMGWLAACANIATVSGAAAPPALGVGAICYLFARGKMKTDYEAATGMTVDGRWLSDAEWNAAIERKNGKGARVSSQNMPQGPHGRQER